MVHPLQENPADAHLPSAEVVDEARPLPVEIVNKPEFQQSRSQAHFSTETITILAGQILTIPRNPYRKLLILFTDAGNAAGVWVSSKESFLTGVAPFPKGILLAANSQPFPFEHTAEIALTSSANATVYMYEERYGRV